MTTDELAALQALADRADRTPWAFSNETRAAALAIRPLLDALDAETARADAVEDSLGGMVEWLAEVIVDTRDALRVGGCDEHVLTAEQLGALEAATRILARERNANPSRFDRMKAERDEARAEVKRLRREVDAIAESHREWERRAREAEAFAAGMERGREALLAECDALRADVERLRHVRNPAADPAPRWGRCPNCGVEHTGDDCMEGKHRHVPDPYMLAGIEAHHVESTETPGWCANAGCGQGWPCVPKKMADEVRRLTAALDAMTGGAAVEAVAKALASHYGDVGYAALHEGDASVAVEAIRALGGAS